MALSSASEQVTRILADLRHGEPGAADRLLPIIYTELHILARRLFASRRPGDTIQPTMLVHDVFMKLTQKTDTEWESRAHFMAVAAKAMRDLLVDQARRHHAAKRGGGWKRITFAGLGQQERMIDVLDLEQLLKKLGEVDERQERIVELRFFAGLSVEDVARVLGVSERTVMYDWRMARAWLRAQLDDGSN